MGLLVSTLLALSAADKTLPAQAFHCGRTAEGWVRSELVRKGMTSDQVHAIIGSYPHEVFLGAMDFDVYLSLGVVVNFDAATNCVNDVRRFSSVQLR